MPASPPCRRSSLVCAAAVLAACRWLAPAAAADWERPPNAAEQRESPRRPVSVRITWGGGKARAWSGVIRLVDGDGGEVVEEPAWRTLCSDADAAATAHGVPGGIVVHEPRGRGFDGIELSIDRWRDRRLAVRLMPDGDERAAVSLEAPVADFMVATRQQPLDRDGNRLSVRASPGDALRVEVTSIPTGAGRSGERSTLFRPGEKVRIEVDPLLPKRSPGTVAVDLRLRLKPGAEGEPSFVQTVALAESPTADDEPQPRLQEYERVVFDVPLPEREGAYDIELEAVERGGLRWSRPLASRVVQVAAVADAVPPQVAGEPAWQVIHELDPGSPRLHERLRRLPGKGIPYVPMPAMPMPSMSLPSVPIPSVPIPNVPLPKMPSVPLPAVGMPSVGMPSVASMVPRLSGLLLTGHSTVDVHPLGPMLRLPPARSAEEPTWEGIVVAGVQPGLPHLVEVEFPLDQRAVVGVCVLEPDALGTTVEVRASGGFEASPSTAGAVDGRSVPHLGKHSFVFWPTSRNPLLLIANPSLRSAALFGRVRISAGPARLPSGAGAEGESRRLVGAEGGRRVHAFMPAPDFSQFGAVERPVAGQGRSFADWRTFLSGATRAAEWFSAQGAAGAMVVVYGDGAAIWPSRLTRDAPRWDNGDAAESGFDPWRKDLLSMLCRVHARQGLRLVPAVSFDAPLPGLEAILHRGGAEAVGIACVGRDGRPRQTDGGGGSHYNILDPRVQHAAEEIVAELAGRLDGADAVDGVALILPHHGWAHLPGAAWGLDDATFSRFLSDVGGQEPAGGPERFARRAALVEGPLHEAWLEWRAATVARFHSRLAAILAAHEPRWSLHVVPTSLFSQGELAGRFRPTLAGPPGDADVLREIGLDPARITSDRRIVFVTPHVHAAADLLLDRGLVEHANRSLAIARGVAGAARRGVIAIEQPTSISVAQVVPHGPFGSASAAGPIEVHAVSEGAARGRGLAESFVASDVEVVFDMGLLFARVDASHAARMKAFAALPVGGFELADPLPAPLVVRSRREAHTTVASVANAGPVPCRAALSLVGSPSAVVDGVDRSRLPLDPGGGAAVPLGPWEVRTLVLDGGVRVAGARVEFDDDVRRSIESRLEDLRRRRAVLETPQPLDALDNPGFELDGAATTESAGRDAGGAVAGWELVEASRGSLRFVPGFNGTAGRGIAFSSVNGLSTLRSNPFSPPATGRISVAAWLRIAAGDAQPPLRIAIEGVQDDHEYYRFAPVGGLAGGKPLTGEWSQFVLQIDDVPVRGLESLRVRLDLLGPGSVQIDGMRVFDLAFDESQRVDLSRQLAIMEQRLAENDVGGCLLELDTYWPRFLAEFVSDDAVATLDQQEVPTRGPTVGPTEPPARSGSVFDRVRRWLQ